MTSTSTLRAGLSWLATRLAALALLLLVAGDAQAQRTIFVDANGGSNGNNGQSATIGAGVNGPVETISRAIELARLDGAGNTISIEAGDYDIGGLDVENSGSSTALNNLVFLARPDQAGNTTVNLDVAGGQEFETSVSGFAFSSSGGAEFFVNGSGDVDFDDGSVDFGSGILTFDLSGDVERTNASTTGSVGYQRVPNAITFNGDDSTAAGSLLPSTLDIGSGSVTVNIALDDDGDDDARTFTLGAGGLTLGDGGGQVTLNVADGNTVAGTITIVDGSGSGSFVDIEGEGSIGDLVVASGVLDYELAEDDLGDADEDNSAASITVRGGELRFIDNDGGGSDDVERFLVTGDFSQTGGVVSSPNDTDNDDEDTILVVNGDFSRTDNRAGNFDPINVYLEGDETATFAPGTNLRLNSLHINGTDDATSGDPKMVTFLQDITVISGDNGTNAGGNILPFIVTDDAEVDLNGNLVNVTGDGESVVNGTISDAANDGAVRFTGGGIASGDGIYSSILIDGPDIDAEGDFEFTGALLLLNGGIDITSGDVSPAGDEAAVVVNIEAANTPRITGTFNDEDVDYDLIYQDSEATGFASGNGDEFDVDAEFDTDNIRDLTVDVTGAVIDATDAEDGTISGDVFIGTLGRGTDPDGATLLFGDDQEIEVAGSTTIEDNAVLALDDDASYAISGTGNVLDGTIDDDGDDDDGDDSDDAGQLRLTDGSAISGTQTTRTGTSDATTESTINVDVRLNDDASASITDVRVINGDISDEATAAGDAGTLTLGLVADDDDTGQADDNQPDFTQDQNGNVNGNVNLDFSTLEMASSLQFTADDSTIRIATLDTGDGFVFFTEAAQGSDDVDVDDGPALLVLTNDVMGTGTLWPSSDLAIRKGDAASGQISNNATLVVPVFHPGDDDEDEIELRSNITVTRILRLTGELDTNDGDFTDNDIRLTVDGSGLEEGSFARIITDEGYSLDGDDGDLVVAGPVDLTVNEFDEVNDFTDRVLSSDQVQTFEVTAEASLSADDDTYNVVNFVVDSANQPASEDETDSGSLDLNSNQLEVSNDVTLANDDALSNSSAGSNRVDGDGDLDDDFSRLSFVGTDDATFTITPDDDGTVTWGDGVDLAIAKADATGSVTLTGGSIVFDDDFDDFDFDDETLILDNGVLIAGDPANPSGIYIRLDHRNNISGASTSDNGQGFILMGDDQFPDSYIDGNVRKRIASDPSAFSGDLAPGRVVYPVGVAAENDEGYAEYVLDFESVQQSQSFGRRSITVSFVNENANPNDILIEDGDDIEDVEDFYWLVRSTPSLGSGTFFNVEARYDGFELASNAGDGSAERINEIRLVRRQFGDESLNPFTLVSDTYDNFLIMDDGDDAEPVVVARDAIAFLGPQGTIFTYESGNRNRAVDNNPGVAVTEFALNGAMPNPFAGRTEISFDLAEAADVSVEVFDVMGRQVLAVNRGGLNAGADQRVALDAGSLASGVYVFRLRAEGSSETHVRSGQITLAR